MENVLLSAFANKTRLQLMMCLASGEKNVSGLIGNCGLSQSAVSQHLEKLRKAGIVLTRRNGKEILYSLKNKQTAAISEQLLTYIRRND